MKILGIIAEYNPFHNGHKYHINEAKLQTNADFVVIIMSGSFTQQGNIAVLNKFERAKIALDCGADLILELPTVYATSSSENFCFGAVDILNSLGCITHLAFGSECQDIESLKSIANKLIQKEDNIILLTKKYLTKGITSAKARDLALSEILEESEYKEISKPNNILGLEYLKSLSKLNSTIEPIIIERKEAGHNDRTIEKSDSIASATSIRTALISEDADLNKIQKLVPSSCFNLLTSKKILSNNNLFELLKYEILKLGKDKISNIHDVSEGLENRIYQAAQDSKNYNELVMGIKSKRYTMGRIKRILIYILLGINKELYSNLFGVKYGRILKVSKNSKSLLKIINKNTTIPILSNISEKHLARIDNNNLTSLNLDVLSANILATLSQESLNKDYTNLID